MFNPNTPFQIKPGTWSPELTEEQAAYLIKMYPRELTNNEGEAARFSGRIQELEAEAKRLAEENKSLREQVAGLEGLLNKDAFSSGITSNVPAAKLTPELVASMTKADATITLKPAPVAPKPVLPPAPVKKVK